MKQITFTEEQPDIPLGDSPIIGFRFARGGDKGWIQRELFEGSTWHPQALDDGVGKGNGWGGGGQTWTQVLTFLSGGAGDIKALLFDTEKELFRWLSSNQPADQ